MNSDINALIHAAARIVSATIDSLPPETVATLDDALAGGAWPAVEVLPLPGRTRVRVVLVEQEGARHELAVIPVREVRSCAH